MKEADPSKLGKALSDTTTRRVIIGVLLMLMILPLLTYSDIDFTIQYGMREIFWFGRSSCVKSADASYTTFMCPDKPWITTEGWYEILRGYYQGDVQSEGDPLTSVLLWLYIPDFTQNGTIRTIPFIP